MTLFFSGMLLALFGLSLIGITLSLRYLRGPAQEPISSPARFCLIALRLAIGWHCFVEGMEKITTPTWSGEAYLRESMGPFSGFFRWIPGDRLVEKLTVGENNSFPPQLDREWRSYVSAFTSYYALTDEQTERVNAVFDQQKSKTLTYLLSEKEEVTKIS